MNHYAGIGEGFALARCSGAEEEGSHGGGHAEADRLDVAGDELHGVVDCQSGGDGSPRAVDVEGDVLFGVFVGEVEELGDEDVGHFVVDVGAEEEDAVFEEAGDDI